MDAHDCYCNERNNIEQIIQILKRLEQGQLDVQGQLVTFKVNLTFKQSERLELEGLHILILVTNRVRLTIGTIIKNPLRTTYLTSLDLHWNWYTAAKIAILLQDYGSNNTGAHPSSHSCT